MFFLRAGFRAACTVATLIGFFNGSTSPEITAQTVESYFAAPVFTGTKSEGPHTYELDYRYFYRDAFGNTLSTIRTEANYTRLLDDGFVRWNGVRIFPGGVSDGTVLGVMEGFCYVVSEDIVKESLYDRFPDTDLKHLIKTMVWDGVMINVFDSLIGGLEALGLNEFRTVTEFEDFDVQMCDWGKIKMRNLRIKWLGISRMNDELCILIHYNSFANPVSAPFMKGRSLYWGQVWISMDDRDVECLTLNEDVILNTDGSTGSGNGIMNIQREVRFQKID